MLVDIVCMCAAQNLPNVLSSIVWKRRACISKSREILDVKELIDRVQGDSTPLNTAIIIRIDVFVFVRT